MDTLRLSGRVLMIASSREILAPSSSLSPNHDPIRSEDQIRLFTATSHWDQSLEMLYVQGVNHLMEITSVILILMTLRMSV